MRIMAVFLNYLFPACLAISGCIVGDSVGVVKGTIHDEKGQAHDGCKLDLMDGTDTVTRVSRSVDEVFIEDFTLEPKERLYRIRIQCQTGKAPVTTELILLGGSKKPPVDLGDIVILRR